jgi:hypothetical protein
MGRPRLLDSGQGRPTTTVKGTSSPPLSWKQQAAKISGNTHGEKKPVAQP